MSIYTKYLPISLSQALTLKKTDTFGLFSYLVALFPVISDNLVIRLLF